MKTNPKLSLAALERKCHDKTITDAEYLRYQRLVRESRCKDKQRALVRSQH